MSIEYDIREFCPKAVICDSFEKIRTKTVCCVVVIEHKSVAGVREGRERAAAIAAESLGETVYGGRDYSYFKGGIKVWWMMVASVRDWNHVLRGFNISQEFVVLHV